MNKRQALKVVLTVSFAILILLAYLYVSHGGFEKELVPYCTEAPESWEGETGPLLLTHWKQDGAYAKYTPEHHPLGCWSVAFAQVLAFHKLQASGEVNYVTSNGTVINRSLSAANWDITVPVVVTDTPPDFADETAKYCYQAAIVLQKDFGSGEYKDVSVIPQELSEHYLCEVERIDTGIMDKIISEIQLKRPVVAYFDDILSIRVVRNGHAAVIDGLARDHGNIYVHINFGWGGGSDGWYQSERLFRQRELQYIFCLRSI